MDSATKQHRKQAAAVLRKVARNPDNVQTDDLLAAWRGRRIVHAGAVAIAGGPQVRLSTLAVSVELDSFTEVKKVMDKMIADVQQEQKDKVDSKAYCVKEIKANEHATYTNMEQKSDVEGTLDSLAARISILEEETANAKTQIAESSAQVKQASETREQGMSRWKVILTCGSCCTGSQMPWHIKSFCSLYQTPRTNRVSPDMLHTPCFSNGGVGTARDARYTKKDFGSLGTVLQQCTTREG